MAITENNFTGDELRAAVQANPEVLKTVKGFLTTEQKYIVHDENEHQTYLKKYEDEKIAPRVSEIAQTMEKDIESITGIKKENKDEKYYDYAKRVLTTLKNDRDNFNREIADLKGKTNLTEAERQRLQELETSLNDTKAQMEKIKGEKETEINSFKIDAQLSTAAAELKGKIKKDLPESLVNLAIANAKAKLIAQGKFQDDGALTFIDKDGKVITDPANAYKPKTAMQLMSEELKDIIDQGKSQPGAGSSGKSNPTAQSSPDGKFTFAGIPSDVTSQEELGYYLKKNGILDGSKEWDDIYAMEDVTKLPIRKKY